MRVNAEGQNESEAVAGPSGTQKKSDSNVYIGKISEKPLPANTKKYDIRALYDSYRATIAGLTQERAEICLIKGKAWKIANLKKAGSTKFAISPEAGVFVKKGKEDKNNEGNSGIGPLDITWTRLSAMIGYESVNKDYKISPALYQAVGGVLENPFAPLFTVGFPFALTLMQGDPDYAENIELLEHAMWLFAVRIDEHRRKKDKNLKEKTEAQLAEMDEAYSSVIDFLTHTGLDPEKINMDLIEEASEYFTETSQKVTKAKKVYEKILDLMSTLRTEGAGEQRDDTGKAEEEEESGEEDGSSEGTGQVGERIE